MDFNELTNLTTEKRNAQTMNLDSLTIHEAAVLMNNEDQKVGTAVAQALPAIENAIKKTTVSLQSGGRIIYMGAGTSGRLGVLDAAECVPTFGVSPETVIGLIAGGETAMIHAVEGAEDSLTLGPTDLQNLNLSAKDTVIGIAASGRTPYVIGGLDYANHVHAATVSLALNTNALISQHADTAIEIDVGPEFLTGSTRLKSGTAQKMVLNMISTISMLGIGKIYKNLMVDVQPTNEKLIERSKHIIMDATDCSFETAEQAFMAANQNVKVAIVMILTGVNRNEAEEKLQQANGFINQSL
ncbi:N-acetylmuramic acid 6-phosphate etherase [Weissella paramesenteroides]|uniref:N-acetylmuramic acid 6-phosphate etherase n=1 Tax=Weissella paramesenteroides TaxID=1249 RepID=UPI00123A9BDF|nr:N-acetylmuramic acid 6-phosphate etherase [Weissella paramesenteroides]KAA8455898.1 N-acetylmuramic acid 6-phosphate etherase [Weissella paramesenteroides]KAA8457309.1 N-acetylmuramic acid 6-phosphate etherase [Weissella paramesenteroides]KAA8459735.1 N-acetylmuramic acid 6-phosphate etherase [Weissella paramesenteroides]KAA8462397.1 N-acetylmuramic acid 6-phosphate etherase [Weissella paramesenteroides]KAA8463583.1 N-acetylmuramic acid 6-phosphate etherase [Weissella paramesenteroides]